MDSAISNCNGRSQLKKDEKGLSGFDWQGLFGHLETMSVDPRKQSREVQKPACLDYVAVLGSVVPRRTRFRAHFRTLVCGSAPRFLQCQGEV